MSSKPMYRGGLINPWLMREVACKIPHRHSGLCYIYTDPLPEEIKQNTLEWLDRPEQADIRESALNMLRKVGELA
jgi:hypothetical protein